MTVLKQEWEMVDQAFSQIAILEEIVTSPNFRLACSELDNSLELRIKISKDPAKFFKGKGVVLPRGVEVTVIPDNWNFSFCARGVCIARTERGKWRITW